MFGSLSARLNLHLSSPRHGFFNTHNSFVVRYQFLVLENELATESSSATSFLVLEDHNFNKVGWNSACYRVRAAAWSWMLRKVKILWGGDCRVNPRLKLLFLDGRLTGVCSRMLLESDRPDGQTVHPTRQEGKQRTQEHPGVTCCAGGIKHLEPKHVHWMRCAKEMWHATRKNVRTRAYGEVWSVHEPETTTCVLGCLPPPSHPAPLLSLRRCDGENGENCKCSEQFVVVTSAKTKVTLHGQTISVQQKQLTVTWSNSTKSWQSHSIWNTSLVRPTPHKWRKRCARYQGNKTCQSMASTRSGGNCPRFESEQGAHGWCGNVDDLVGELGLFEFFPSMCCCRLLRCAQSAKREIHVHSFSPRRMGSQTWDKLTTEPPSPRQEVQAILLMFEKVREQRFLQISFTMQIGRLSKHTRRASQYSHQSHNDSTRRKKKKKRFKCFGRIVRQHSAGWRWSASLTAGWVSHKAQVLVKFWSSFV